MSSASVFNPHVLAELRHIKPSPISDRLTTNYTPNFVAISSVKRNIFGPIDHEECKKFVEKQLKHQQAQDREYWGFDFVHEVPRPGNSRFIWEAIPEKPVTRPQKRSYRDTMHDISHLYPEPLDDLRMENDEKKSINKKRSKTEAHYEKTKQLLITDFLKSKKAHRLHLKKSLNTPSPNRTGRILRSRKEIRS